MTPVSTGLMGEVIYAKDQPEYIPLPAYRCEDGTVVTKWKLSFGEWLAVLFRRHVYLTVMTFNQPLQPVRLTVKVPWKTMEGE